MSASAGPASAADVVLHIGLMKSGTTYLQRVLHTNRARLAEQGFAFPGDDWRLQVLAVEELIDRRTKGKPVVAGSWDALVAAIGAHAGPSLVSMEFLSAADAKQAGRAVASFPGRRVRVVITVRDLARTIPALWQERVRTGDTATYPEFVQFALSSGRSVRHPRKRMPLRGQDLERVLTTWQPLVAPEDLVVVTVPPNGAPRDLLWQRFCEAVGLDPAGFALEGQGNESLGAVSVELIRRMNEVMGDKRHRWAVRQRVKYRLGRQVLVARRDVEPTLVLPASARDAVAERADAIVAAVAQAGPTVIGDLSELRVADPPTGSRETTEDPTSLPDSDLLAAAVDALATLMAPGRRATADDPGSDPDDDFDTDEDTDEDDDDRSDEAGDGEAFDQSPSAGAGEDHDG